MSQVSVAIEDRMTQPTPGAVINSGTYWRWAPSRFSSRVSVTVSRAGEQLPAVDPTDQTPRMAFRTRSTSSGCRSSSSCDGEPDAGENQFMSSWPIRGLRVAAWREFGLSSESLRPGGPDPRALDPQPARRPGNLWLMKSTHRWESSPLAGAGIRTVGLVPRVRCWRRCWSRLRSPRALGPRRCRWGPLIASRCWRAAPLLILDRVLLAAILV
jgi:hypothetical protein